MFTISLKGTFYSYFTQTFCIFFYIFRLLFIYTSESYFCAWCGKEIYFHFVYMNSKLFQSHLFNTLSFSHWFWGICSLYNLQIGMAYFLSFFSYLMQYLGLICASNSKMFLLYFHNSFLYLKITFSFYLSSVVCVLHEFCSTKWALGLFRHGQEIHICIFVIYNYIYIYLYIYSYISNMLLPYNFFLSFNSEDFNYMPSIDCLIISSS